jgi:hypothetical protein
LPDLTPVVSANELQIPAPNSPSKFLRHVQTVPSLLRATENSLPNVMAITLLNPAARTGVIFDIQVPLPTGLGSGLEKGGGGNVGANTNYVPGSWQSYLLLHQRPAPCFSGVPQKIFATEVEILEG